MRGDIEYDAAANKTYFNVKKTADGEHYEYRPFDPALDVNPQENFTQAHTELRAFVMDGPFSNFAAGVSMTADLNKYTEGLAVGTKVAERDDGVGYWVESGQDRTKLESGQGAVWADYVNSRFTAL